MSRIGLPDVLVEQVDGALREPAHRLVGVAGQREQIPEREAELQEPERRPDQLDVAGRVAGLAVHLVPDPDALPFDGLDQGRRHAARGGERVEREQLALRGLAALGRHGRRQPRVREAELAVEDPADRGEREPLALERRIRRIRSTCSSRYQATRPSLSGCGSRPRAW